MSLWSECSLVGSDIGNGLSNTVASSFQDDERMRSPRRWHSESQQVPLRKHGVKFPTRITRQPPISRKMRTLNRQISPKRCRVNLDLRTDVGCRQNSKRHSIRWLRRCIQLGQISAHDVLKVQSDRNNNSDSPTRAKTNSQPTRYISPGSYGVVKRSLPSLKETKWDNSPITIDKKPERRRLDESPGKKTKNQKRSGSPRSIISRGSSKVSLQSHASSFKSGTRTTKIKDKVVSNTTFDSLDNVDSDNDSHVPTKKSSKGTKKLKNAPVNKHLNNAKIAKTVIGGTFVKSQPKCKKEDTKPPGGGDTKNLHEDDKKSTKSSDSFDTENLLGNETDKLRFGMDPALSEYTNELYGERRSKFKSAVQKLREESPPLQESVVLRTALNDGATEPSDSGDGVQASVQATDLDLSETVCPDQQQPDPETDACEKVGLSQNQGIDIPSALDHEVRPEISSGVELYGFCFLIAATTACLYYVWDQKSDLAPY